MTIVQSKGSNATPTGELPVVTPSKPSPTRRAAVAADTDTRPETMTERVRRVQAERHAAAIEQYCSARTTPRHRYEGRRGQVRSTDLAPVGLPRVEPRTEHAPSLLARLVGGAR